MIDLVFKFDWNYIFFCTEINASTVVCFKAFAIHKKII